MIIKYLKMCSESDKDKNEHELCKSGLYRLYKSGRDFEIIKGRIILLNKEKNMNYKELTKMIITLLFVIGSVISFFITVNQVGEELVRLVTVAILAYYFGGSTIAAKLRRSK